MKKLSYLNKVIVGDCFKIMSEMDEQSVDLVVTSPPYWGIRSYEIDSKIWGGDSNCEHLWDNKNKCLKCDAWKGELGLEPHPQMFIKHLVEFGKLVSRVLKPTGLFWLNLGDTFCGGGKSKKNQLLWQTNHSYLSTPPGANVEMDGGWLQPKQLLMMPSRVACRLQDDGWILRSDIIWHKSNHMPEGIKDRFSKTYEHFFMFSKQSKYYFNLDAVRVPHKASVNNPNWKNTYIRKATNKTADIGKIQNIVKEYNPLGKNPGDIWEVTPQPFHGSHFAVFPENLIERIIKSSCPTDGIVLDPFSGSGTSLYIAHKLGLNYIGIDIKQEYVKMAEERIEGKIFKKTRNVKND